MAKITIHMLGDLAEAKLDPEFGEKLISLSHHYAFIMQKKDSVFVLISSRDYGRTVFEADRVILACIEVTPNRVGVKGMTPLIRRSARDADDAWAQKLRTAAQGIEVDPKFLEKLGDSFEIIELLRPSAKDKSEV